MNPLRCNVPVVEDAVLNIFRPGDEYMLKAELTIKELRPTLMAELHEIRHDAKPSRENYGFFLHAQVIDGLGKITEFGRQCCMQDRD